MFCEPLDQALFLLPVKITSMVSLLRSLCWNNEKHISPPNPNQFDTQVETAPEENQSIKISSVLGSERRYYTETEGKRGAMPIGSRLSSMPATAINPSHQSFRRSVIRYFNLKSNELVEDALSPVEFVCLLPQSIGSELPERSLDSRPGIRIFHDCPTTREGASKKPSLATDEESSCGEEEVCGYVAKHRGLDELCHVGNWFSSTVSELHMRWLVPCLERIEHSQPRGPYTECEQRSKAEAN